MSLHWCGLTHAMYTSTYICNKKEWSRWLYNAESSLFRPDATAVQANYKCTTMWRHNVFIHRRTTCSVNIETLRSKPLQNNNSILNGDKILTLMWKSDHDNVSLVRNNTFTWELFCPFSGSAFYWSPVLLFSSISHSGFTLTTSGAMYCI